jgi:hypothetical protein
LLHYALSVDERESLAHLGLNDEEADRIERAIRRSRRSLFTSKTIPIIAIALIFLRAAYISTLELFSGPHGRHVPKDLAADTAIYYLVGVILLSALLLCSVSPDNQYYAFKSAFRAARKVNSALGTVPMSKQRIKLAREIRRSSGWIRQFAPKVGVGMHNRIAKIYAIRASRTAQALLYPALLGDDKELEMARSTLAVMALKIGKSRWMEIGRLDTHTESYEPLLVSRTITTSDRLISVVLVALTAIPAIPVLVDYLKLVSATLDSPDEPRSYVPNRPLSGELSALSGLVAS